MWSVHVNFLREYFAINPLQGRNLRSVTEDACFGVLRPVTQEETLSVVGLSNSSLETKVSGVCCARNCNQQNIVAVSRVHDFTAVTMKTMKKREEREREKWVVARYTTTGGNRIYHRF
jgi:hypothetical protein